MHNSDHNKTAHITQTSKHEWEYNQAAMCEEFSTTAGWTAPPQDFQECETCKCNFKFG